jgi:putative transposase
MAGKRKNHTPAFKAQAALAALKGDRTVNELAGHFGVHPTLIHAWKKQLLAGAEAAFTNGAKGGAADADALQRELYEQIGRLKMELEWVKKTRVANLASLASVVRVGNYERRSDPCRAPDAARALPTPRP